jgi:hypothetical protein
MCPSVKQLARCCLCAPLQGALGLLQLTTRVSTAWSQSSGPGVTRACWTATTMEQSAEVSRSTSRWDRQTAVDTAAGRQPSCVLYTNLCADT